MQPVTDPIPPEVNPAYAFLAEQIGLLGSRDPLDVLAETEGRLREVTANHSAETLRHRRTEGKWTPLEILAHMADMEWIFGFRARTILCDDQPRLPEIDQDAWIQRQHPNDLDPDSVVESFRALRGVNLEMWRRTTAEDRQRTGEHVGAGITISLDTLLRVQAGHDLRHLLQLQDALA
jgi:hypothetical protein